MFIFPGGSPAPAVMTYIGSTPHTPNNTSATYTAHAIGTASADRLVIVAATGNMTSGEISGVTCGGIAMTEVVKANGSGRATGIYSLVVASGTTATIVVSYTGTSVQSSISVYTLTSLSSTTATHTASNTGVDSVATASINYSAYGAVIGVCIIDDTPDVTWTNLTENYDAGIEVSSGHSAASKTVTTTVTGESVSVTFSGSDNHSLVVASWR